MTEHTTHYEDCGCLSKRFAERIAELERDNRNMHSLNDGMRETVAELEANAEELMAEVKMYGAANGELKDALDEALTELAATMNALSAAHEALTSAETCIVALEKRVQQAETELAALKGRRCEGCRYWLANGCPQIGGWHPADFSCSEWQPLPETRP